MKGTEKDLQIIITTEQIAEKLYEIFKKVKLSCFVLPKCRGFSQSSSFFEFIGMTSTKVELLAFSCKERLRKYILNFLLTNYNKPNNGIMLTLGGDEKMETKNKMLVVIINEGQAEKVTDILRKHGSCGSTVFDARGISPKIDSVVGIEIDSNKDIVLSVMTEETLKAVSEIIKESLKDSPGGVILFNLPVSDFNKLHGEVAVS